MLSAALPLLEMSCQFAPASFDRKIGVAALSTVTATRFALPGCTVMSAIRRPAGIGAACRGVQAAPAFVVLKISPPLVPIHHVFAGSDGAMAIALTSGVAPVKAGVAIGLKLAPSVDRYGRLRRATIQVLAAPLTASRRPPNTPLSALTKLL